MASYARMALAWSKQRAGGHALSKKKEAGKFIIAIGVVIGLAVGSIFLLNSFVFKPKSLPSNTKAPEAAIVEQSDQQKILQEEQQPTPPQPLESKKSAEQPAEVAEPFYAKFKDGEYIGVWNQNGTEKQISLTLGTKEVKNLLGNPLSESYEDGESTYLCYQYGNLSIYFEDGNQTISFMTYEDNDRLLEKKWLAELEKTQDTGNVDFYESPTGYTSVKVDHLPETKQVIVYLQNQYGSTDDIQPSVEQAQTVTETQPAPQKEPSQAVHNGNGNYTMHPGEEITIDELEVTNKSPYHSATYQIDVNYHFAYNNSNWVKVITNPEKKIELMPGETSAVQIKVKASKHAPKGSYRYIILLKQGWESVAMKEFTVEVQ
ncbi:MAG: hypothetical protein K0R47_5336 [Brevibacillus sp.]|nr:hypothetical protein [Brevibacillus sp.]